MEHLACHGGIKDWRRCSGGALCAGWGGEAPGRRTKAEGAPGGQSTGSEGSRRLVRLGCRAGVGRRGRYGVLGGPRGPADRLGPGVGEHGGGVGRLHHLPRGGALLLRPFSRLAYAGVRHRLRSGDRHIGERRPGHGLRAARAARGRLRALRRSEDEGVGERRGGQRLRSLACAPARLGALGRRAREHGRCMVQPLRHRAHQRCPEV
mmetsp:Transcript_68448/g.222708  ORF Transcript_68448/g.222708 Transcript_68448/m.222708 type:complete len:207 (-) Transcript_68448:793-1413(-)